jgi:hypothetical protein
VQSAHAPVKFSMTVPAFAAPATPSPNPPAITIAAKVARIAQSSSAAREKRRLRRKSFTPEPNFSFFLTATSSGFAYLGF